jgi:hypothetical protein
LIGYDSNLRAYHVFNKDSGYVETTYDAVFDETNGSQVEKYDLNVVDDEEAPCDALQRMAIGDAPSEHQASQAPNDTTPPTQDHEQDKEDEHKDEQDEPQNEDQVHDQEENMDQGGDEDDGDHE